MGKDCQRGEAFTCRIDIAVTGRSFRECKADFKLSQKRVDRLYYQHNQCDDGQQEIGYKCLHQCHILGCLITALFGEFPVHNRAVLNGPFLPVQLASAKQQNDNQGNGCGHKAGNCGVDIHQQQLAAALNHCHNDNCQQALFHCLALAIEPADCHAADDIPQPDKQSSPCGSGNIFRTARSQSRTHS